MAEYRELLLGCGPKPWEKKLYLKEPRDAREWHNLTTVDYNPAHGADWELDLFKTFQRRMALPFADDSFDEIHAYELLEHTGQQGDEEGFFWEWIQYWRILKPGGSLFGTCPGERGIWLWGDPGHKRLFGPQSLLFLQQPLYTAQVGKSTMSDYRHIYKADFEKTYETTIKVGTPEPTYCFILKAIKPSRISV